jgi:hypothetical protein
MSLVSGHTRQHTFATEYDAHLAYNEIHFNGKSITLIGPSEEARAEGKSTFGEKNISFFGGFCLNLNNITGPAMVSIPVIYQQAGWLPTTLGMVIVMIIAAFSSTMMCKAMALVPGNERFQSRVEIEGLAKIFFNKWGYYLTLLFLIVSLQATNISSIIISAQTVDFALVAMFKYTCGLEFYPDFGYDSVTTAGDDSNTPFGDVVIISLGFLLVFMGTLPMAYFNLDDNVWVQIGAAGIMITIVLGVWMVDFFMVGLNLDQLDVIGSNQSQLLGTVIFNFAFVTSIPSWANEKKEGVSINRSIWGSAIVGTSLFILMGLFGAWTFKYPLNANILDVLISKANSVGHVMRIIVHISVYLFPIVVLLSSIPVYSIIIRYNLIESGLCGKHWANVWAVLFPWVFSVPFYTGSGLSNIISWVGLFVNGFINFVIPLLFYIIALRRYGGMEPVGRAQILSGIEPNLSVSLSRDDNEPAGSRRSFDVGLLRLEVQSIQERAPTVLLDAAAPGRSLDDKYEPYDDDDDEELFLNADPALLAAIEADLRFRSVPKFLALRFPPIWLAGVLATIITIGIVATIILDIVYLAQGEDVMGG